MDTGQPVWMGREDGIVAAAAALSPGSGVSWWAHCGMSVVNAAVKRGHQHRRYLVLYACDFRSKSLFTLRSFLQTVNYYCVQGWIQRWRALKDLKPAELVKFICVPWAPNTLKCVFGRGPASEPTGGAWRSPDSVDAQEKGRAKAKENEGKRGTKIHTKLISGYTALVHVFPVARDINPPPRYPNSRSATAVYYFYPNVHFYLHRLRVRYAA